MKIKKKFLIGNGDSGRLDRFLAEKFPSFPRMFWKKEIKNGNVKVNKEETKPKYKLKEKDEIEIDAEKDKNDFKIKSEKNISFDVLFQNEDFAIIDKPAGISVHPSENEKSGTLVNGLLEKFPEIKNVGEDPMRPGIVHRLDKETSGLMVVALSQKAFDFFKDAFRDRKIEKKYTALVWGDMKKKEGDIKGYIGKSKSDPVRQSFSQESSKVDNPKNSFTHFRVTKKIKGMMLVELSPKTGRMHQLRVHLHSIGHPIVGDKKYSNKEVKEVNKKYPRHMLHAGYLRFELWDGQEYCYQSSLPDDFYRQIDI